MESSRLAARMLEWEQMKKQLDILEAEIKAAVLEIGKTQTVGNIRVTYSAGRRSFDYETVGMSAPTEIINDNSTYTEVTDWQAACEKADVPEEVIQEFTTLNVSVDWKSVCEKANIEPLVIKQAEPSATIKLLA